jgi:hypothetical protein
VNPFCNLQSLTQTHAALIDLILIFGVLRHFQQYFSYIMATSFSGGRSRSSGENHRPWTSNW